jgi:hypothetical protein
MLLEDPARPGFPLPAELGDCRCDLIRGPCPAPGALPCGKKRGSYLARPVCQQRVDQIGNRPRQRSWPAGCHQATKFSDVDAAVTARGPFR